MKKKNYLVAGLIIFLIGQAEAQQMLGYSASNFAGIHGVYANPAAIADSRLGFSLNLSSIDGNITNNYLRYQGPYSIFKMFKDEMEFKEEYLAEDNNGKPKILSATADYRGPSFMLSLSPKHSIAFTSRVRGAVQGNNVSEGIAHLFKTRGEADDLLNKMSSNNEFSTNANAIAELGISYARVIREEGPHFLKGGFTLKKLTGIYTAHLINEELQYTVTERNNAADPTVQDKVLVIDQIKARYGYVSEDALTDLNSDKVLDWLFKGKGPGRGWGMDLGFVYEYRPKLDKYRQIVNGKEQLDARKNKYRYRLGISLTDMGGIKYQDVNAVKNLVVDKTNKELNLSDFDNADDTEEYAQVINNALGIAPSDIKTSFRSGLPTALNINFDYKLAGKLYVNTRWVQSLRGKYAVAMRQNSLVAITPRLETKGLELALPLSLQNNYTVAAVGGMIKLGPLFVGSDNIGSLFNIGKAYGANLYAGLSLLNIRRGKKVKAAKQAE